MPVDVLNGNEAIANEWTVPLHGNTSGTTGVKMNSSRTDTVTLDYRLHHGSHRRLLRTISAAEVLGARIDAILVPAARPAESLDNAMALARDLCCGVVALCSHEVNAAQAAAGGDDAKVPVIAFDMGEDDYGLPTFKTAQLPPEFSRTSDTSTKRNLGLVLGKVAGWRRVLFLDDDIYAVEPSSVRAAAALTTEFDVVGLGNTGYPDNSVVCHAYRELDGGQQQFIGVGAMAVDAQSNHSFFPNIYNQDWMFMLGCATRPRLAVTGQMKQDPYDPFEDPDRARREEFGDCLAEGLYWLLDEKNSIERADIDHWNGFLENRQYFIKHLIARVIASGYERGWIKRVRTSLRVAQVTSSKVTPEACVEFVERWRADLVTWREFIAQLPVDLGVAKALKHLGWPGTVHNGLRWPQHP
jgi:hypothetical protein